MRAFVTAVVLVASSCAVTDGGDDTEVTAVATTAMLGDPTNRVIECGGGKTTTLMPVGTDPHDYAPSSTAAGDMVEADLVVANGLGLEWIIASALVFVALTRNAAARACLIDRVRHRPAGRADRPRGRMPAPTD